MIPAKKIKKGMIVRIKKYSYNPSFFDPEGEMQGMGGDIVTIMAVDVPSYSISSEYICYLLKEDDESWTWRNIDFVKVNTIQKRSKNDY